MNVIKKLTFEPKRFGFFVIVQDLQETILDKDERRMQEIIERFKQKCSQDSPQISSGTLSAEIIRQVFCNKHDLVIMTEDKKGGFKERFFEAPPFI